jgi:ABC-type proline/glycine betaine transport system permease subunit
MTAILEHIAARGDIGHIGLLLWALGASALLSRTLGELAEANRRFDAFVRELARFNQRHTGDTP